MTNLTPNSPEFARLNDTEKLRILADRFTARTGFMSLATLAALRRSETEEKEEKPLWPTPTAEAAALQRWQNGQRIPAYFTYGGSQDE